MKSPAASVWLDVWERGMSLAPAYRPLLLLEARHGSESQPARWPLGRREAALLELRTALFGGDMESLAACPQCGSAVEFTLQAAEIIASTAAPIPEEVSVSAAGHEASFRLPNAHDSEAAECLPAAQRRESLLERCLVEGELPAGGWPEEFMVAASRAMSAADPLGDLSLGLKCPDCSHAWEALFDTGSFLWTEIHAWASRLMAEIHTLASAYGWTEGEILALPPHRRRFYLGCLSRHSA